MEKLSDLIVEAMNLQYQVNERLLNMLDICKELEDIGAVRDSINVAKLSVIDTNNALGNILKGLK